MPRATLLEPQLATLVDEAPSGDEWLHEMKLDGYRLLAERRGTRVALVTRNGNDWAARVPRLVEALRALADDDFVLDGELVAMNDRGVSDFQTLQNSLHDGAGAAPLVYFAFDALRVGGEDVTDEPLEARKKRLAALVGRKKTGMIRVSEHVVGDGPRVFAEAGRLGMEGIICKRRDRPYRPGRSGEWLKVKCKKRQEFVVGGFSAPRASRSHFGALLLGLHGRDGKLRYAGKVGTGFSSSSLEEIHERLLPLAQDRPAFVNPPRGADARDVTWLRPELLAEIEYAELTRDGRVRHASFQGMRDDKAARGVKLEEPVRRTRRARG
jgi:bifunctional non-homologous end joining protein LigD